MAFYNKTLIFSLTQELREIKNLCNVITTKYNDLDVTSWLFPTKSYRDIEETHLNFDKIENSYRLCLELLIDRLYLFLQLINTHVEKLIEHLKIICCTPRNIKRPSNLSLVTSVNILWKNLLKLENSMTNCNKEVCTNNEIKLLTVSVDTQTENVVIRSCDSCEISKQCIKTISSAIISSIKFSNVEKAKDRVQTKLYDMTQFGCMNLLTTSIVADMQKLVTDNEYLDCSNQRCNQEIEQLSKMKELHISTIESLEEKIKYLEKYYETEKHNVEDLEEKLIHISNVRETEIKNLNEKVRQLESASEILNSELSQSKTENEKWKMIINTYEEKLQNIEQINIEKCDVIEQLKSDNIILKNKTEKQKIIFTKALTDNKKYQDLLNKLKEENKTLSTKLEAFNCDIFDRSAEIDKWKVKCSNLEEQNSKFIAEIANRSLVIDELKKKTFMTKKKIILIDNKLLEYNKHLNEKLDTYENVLKSFQELVHRKVEELNENKMEDLLLNPTMIKDIEVKGDPLPDMVNQMEVNNKNIKILEEQNMSLKKTIERLQEIRNIAVGR